MRKILLMLAALVAASCSSYNIENEDMKIIAHRGGALLGNENTLSAFRKGIEAGADMIELDVHLTADGAVVVCHDESVDRTTDGEGRIGDMTLSDFKSVHALDRETGEPTDETLPTLEEALDLIKGHADILLEIKRSGSGQYGGLERKVLDLVASKGMCGNVIIQSFDDCVLENVHLLAPDVRVEKLIVCRLFPGVCIDNGINSFSFEKYNFCASINSMGAFTSKRFVRDCHRAGKEVKIWTVNSPGRVVPGVDGVITNRPDLFRK